MTPQDQFERCYQIWTPTRKNRGVCRKAWQKYAVAAVEKGETTYDEIFERILGWNRYFKAVNKERKFIKLFETWIRNDGWLDDIPSASESRGCELKKDRFFKKEEIKKASDKTYQDSRAKLKEMGILK